jgi:4-carboxymuconolactone decarboxylase
MPAIPPEQWTAAQRVAAEEISSGPRGGVVGPFIAALRSPECMRRLQHFGAYLRYDSAIPPRLRETVILLTARRWRQDYEWWTHVEPARQAGVLEATLEAIRTGTLPAAPSPDDAVIFELCDVLFADGRVPDALYARALALLGEPGLIDVICAVGYYSTLALIMNATGTALPEGASAPLWGSIPSR